MLQGSGQDAAVVQIGPVDALDALDEIPEFRIPQRLRPPPFDNRLDAHAARNRNATRVLHDGCGRTMT